HQRRRGGRVVEAGEHPGQRLVGGRVDLADPAGVQDHGGEVADRLLAADQERQCGHPDRGGRGRGGGPPLTGDPAVDDGPARGTASATVDQRGQPYRSAMGARSQASSTVSAVRLIAVFTQPAASVGRTAIGAIASAANGGYVKPSVVPGDTKSYRFPPWVHQ